jgi:hypothetical protein
MDDGPARRSPLPPVTVHEVRTALTAALARVQLARRGLDAGGGVQTDAHLGEAERAIRRAIAAVEDRQPPSPA